MSMQMYSAYQSGGNPNVPRVPAHWKIERFRRVASINEGQVDPRIEPWASSILVAPNHIERDTGRQIGRETAAAQGADSGKYPVKAGQIIYSKIRPALNKAALIDEDCLCSADMYPISFAPGINTRFALYQILASPIHRYTSMISSRVKMPKINRGELANAPWLSPSAQEQQSIADYLDRETARIDILISKQNKLVEILRERRTAIIDRMISPTAGPLRSLGGLTINGIASGVDYAATAGEAGWPRYIRTTDVASMSSLRAYDVRRISAVQAGTSVIRRNDILFTRSGSLGKNYLHESDETMAFAGYMVRFRPRSDRCYARYVAWWSQSKHHLDQIVLGASRSTINNFSGSKFRSMKIPLPSLNTQYQISAQLDSQIASVDSLVVKAEQLIILARERRTALITAAVTGQIDVRARS